MPQIATEQNTTSNQGDGNARGASVSIDALTFGVEIECYLPRGKSREELMVALGDVGLTAFVEDYNHRLSSGWKLTTDGSLDDYTRGTEVVSPILRGEDGIAEMKKVIRTIERFGCSVNRTCGFHVHVGVRGLDHERVGFFKELFATYARFEPVLDQLMAPSRRQNANSYCRSVKLASDVESRAKAARNVNEFRTAIGSGDYNRYRKLNLESFWRHGTVEFRQHQGTLSSQKAENWVRLCLRMVAHAAKNDEPDVMTVREPPPRTVRRDLTQARAVPTSSLNRAESRYHRATWLIRLNREVNPRRPGSRGAEHWDRVYTDEMTIGAFRTRNGGFNHLRWDVEHGFVTVIDARTAPIIEDEVPVTTTPATVPHVTRPATDTAPVTLDGLMDLIGATDRERSYFAERMMELNP